MTAQPCKRLPSYSHHCKSFAATLSWPNLPLGKLRRAYAFVGNIPAANEDTRTFATSSDEPRYRRQPYPARSTRWIVLSARRSFDSTNDCRLSFPTPTISANRVLPAHRCGPPGNLDPLPDLLVARVRYTA